MLIPAGAEIDGRWPQFRAAMLGGPGSIRLRAETVILADGTRYQPLRRDYRQRPGSNTHVVGEGTIKPDSRWKRDSIEYGGAVGAGAVTGAVMGGPVGALTGGLIGAGVVTTHLLVSHPQATLEPGTHAAVYADRAAAHDPAEPERELGAQVPATRAEESITVRSALSAQGPWDPALPMSLRAPGFAFCFAMWSSGFWTARWELSAPIWAARLPKASSPKMKLSQSLSRIEPTLEREALGGADFAIEAASERFEVKAEIFRSLDRILPAEAILADQHFFHLHHEAGRARPRPGASDRHALLQSCAGDGAGRSCARPGNQR